MKVKLTERNKSFWVILTDDVQVVELNVCHLQIVAVDEDDLYGGLVGCWYSKFVSGEPGEHGEQGLLWRRLPDRLSMLKW